MFALQNAEDFQWTASFIQNLYKIHIDTKSQDRREFFHNFSLITEYSFKVLVVFFAGCYVMLMLYPTYMFFVLGRMELVIPLYMPGIDAFTPSGYAITMFYQFILFSTSLCIFLGFEYLIGIISINSLIFSKLIITDLKQMNCDLHGNRSGKFEAICRFRNILLMQL